MNANQLEMMRHALGYGSGSSAPGSRNYYCAEAAGGDAADWEGLCREGLACRGRTINGGADVYFVVTESGKAVVAQDEDRRQSAAGERPFDVFYEYREGDVIHRTVYAKTAGKARYKVALILEDVGVEIRDAFRVLRVRALEPVVRGRRRAVGAA